jgi:ribosomal protein S18 acetylase RimI-like enzyme
VEGVEIVEAGLERLDAVQPLWLALAAHHGALTPAELPVRAPEVGWRLRRERYRRALEEGAVLLLAEGPEEALGYAFARPGSAPEALAIKRPLEVETVAVLPAARGRGIGTALMDAVDAWARERGIEHLTLAVRTNNDGARRLYERRGFRSVYETMYATLERRE